jgi:predicted aspartyl protease
MLLVDTGTSRTMLTRRDVAEAGISLANLQLFDVTTPMTASGPLRCYAVPANLWLQDVDTRRTVRHSLVVDVPEQDVAEDMPSLLGRDVINQYRLVVDRLNDTLTLDDSEKYA